MISIEQIEKWKTTVAHYNVRDNNQKLRVLIGEMLAEMEKDIDRAKQTNVSTPKRVSGNSKKKS